MIVYDRFWSFDARLWSIDEREKRKTLMQTTCNKATILPVSTASQQAILNAIYLQ